MAKTLEKVTKEYYALLADLGSLSQDAREVESDFIQLRSLAREYAKQAGHAALELKAKGHAGTCLDDFRGEKEIKSYLKKWDEQETAAKRLGAKVKQVVKEFPAKYKQLQTMKDELDEEIANRKKKANRKFFKIQSESLPQLEKLRDHVDKDVNKLSNTFDGAQESIQETAEGFDTSFEEEFDSIFKTAAKNRPQTDVGDMAAAAKNVRVQIKYLREGRAMQEEIKQLCAEVAKAVKNGDSPQEYLDSAVKIYRKMSDTAKIQQKLLDSFSANAKKTATGDAKKVIDSANAYIALNKQTLTLLNKTTSASMGAVGSRKGKEKV